MEANETTTDFVVMLDTPDEDYCGFVTIVADSADEAEGIAKRAVCKSLPNVDQSRISAKCVGQETDSDEQ